MSACHSSQNDLGPSAPGFPGCEVERTGGSPETPAWRWLASLAEQSQGLQTQASRLPSPLFALLSKRKYFEHFMGTWGGEEGSGRGSIQEKQPPRRLLPRKPKGGGQEGSPLSGQGWSLRRHGSQEGSQGAVHGRRDPLTRGVSPHNEPGKPLSPSVQASFPAVAAAASAPGATPEPAHPFTPTEQVHSFPHARLDSFIH